MLDSLLARLPRQTDPNVLVGFETYDDAGVYLVADGVALVQTVDFFTPIVDDPYQYGQIAAANSLSDVYAMGGRPISALTLVAYPDKGDTAILEQILRGGLDKMIEAGCSVIGGHSIKDPEIKFGYAVTGIINPKRVWRNVGAVPGDVLLLTKPLGTGVITTALKNDAAPQNVVDTAAASMARLNRDAAEALLECGSLLPPPGANARNHIHAATDITGFGLLGHAREMAAGSKVSIELDHAAIEYLPGAVDAARGKFFAGGLKANREFIEGCVEFAGAVAEEYRALLYDPQTSGGLFVAIAADAAETALTALARRNVSGRLIGRVLLKRSPLISIR
jgi:selenide,water dikinase